MKKNIFYLVSVIVLCSPLYAGKKNHHDDRQLEMHLLESEAPATLKQPQKGSVKKSDYQAPSVAKPLFVTLSTEMSGFEMDCGEKTKPKSYAHAVNPYLPVTRAQQATDTDNDNDWVNVETEDALSYSTHSDYESDYTYSDDDSTLEDNNDNDDHYASKYDASVMQQLGSNLSHYAMLHQHAATQQLPPYSARKVTPHAGLKGISRSTTKYSSYATHRQRSAAVLNARKGPKHEPRPAVDKKEKKKFQPKTRTVHTNNAGFNAPEASRESLFKDKQLPVVGKGAFMFRPAGKSTSLINDVHPVITATFMLASRMHAMQQTKVANGRRKKISTRGLALRKKGLLSKPAHN